MKNFNASLGRYHYGYWCCVYRICFMLASAGIWTFFFSKMVVLLFCNVTSYVLIIWKVEWKFIFIGTLWTSSSKFSSFSSILQQNTMLFKPSLICLLQPWLPFAFLGRLLLQQLRLLKQVVWQLSLQCNWLCFCWVSLMLLDLCSFITIIAPFITCWVSY